MKLRIQGISLRLRLAPSEVSHLLETGRVEDTIYFTSDENARLTYALEHTGTAIAISVRWAPQHVAVVIPTEQVRRWAGSQETGLYGEVHTSHGLLKLAIEKDFACLDKTAAENIDRFPNPRQGSAC